MKSKILICFLIFSIYSNIIYASRFKFIFSPLTIPAISSQQSKESPKTYCDTAGHWCSYSAERLHNEGIFTGLKIGNKYYFQPEQQITRGDFLLYIYAVLNEEPAEEGYAPFEDFASIPVWQKPAAVSMYKDGIIHGNVENGKLYFNHDEGITRLEAAQILCNTLKLKNEPAMTAFSDNYLIPQYASGAVKNVMDYGLMQGYEDKSFRPYIRMTRAMLADVLCRFKDYCEKEKKDIK